MTSVGGLALAGAALHLHGLALSVPTFGSTLGLSVGDVLRTAASLVVLALLWWPFAVAAILGAWLVFTKAGRPGWACLVPGYNGAEFLRVAKLPPWLWVLFLVPVANIALFTLACVRVARLFHKGPRFAAGLVLLPPVYMTILGMGAARYQKFDVLEGTADEADPWRLRAVPGTGRLTRAASAATPVRLVAIPCCAEPTVPVFECGAGERRAAAGGERMGRPPGRPCPPQSGPATRRLHLV
jgi:Family of unknown function (DUF5684)